MGGRRKQSLSYTCYHTLMLHTTNQQLLVDFVKQRTCDKCKKVSSYLETALQQVFACDDVRDFGLIQPMCNGHGSESGVQGHNCQIQLHPF